MVVPYIGTWIETGGGGGGSVAWNVVPYIGTWIETDKNIWKYIDDFSRTLYRYVD